MTDEVKVRAIAFHLPQYHPIPENDEFWGKGFTDWTNVVKAKPLFAGHYQPHLPADLGFYDLRLPEARRAQANLAREYGIHGFCYYHYWFNGRRVLERPVNEILASGDPDFPFCVCWANENWTRRWDGRDQQVLLRQVYSASDDIDHIRSLIPMFKDPRYIKIHEKPLFLVYRLGNLPDPAGTINRWREEAGKAGLPGLYLANVESFSEDHGLAGRLPLDAAVEFAPDWQSRGERIKASYRPFPFLRKKYSGTPWTDNTVVKYEALVEAMRNKAPTDYLRYRCVTPMWDNSARRSINAAIFSESSPSLYERWLTATVQDLIAPSPEENFVFINAWNEWAEGNHLEPCKKWGLAYLDATRSALRAIK